MQNHEKNRITSVENPKFRLWSSLFESRGIKKSQLFIVSGAKVISEVFEHNCSWVRTILLHEEDRASDLAQRALRLMPESIFLLSAPLFKSLDLYETRAPLLICSVPEIPQWNEDSKPHGIEVLTALSDPINLGSLIRTCVAFSVSKLVLLKESAHPFLPKVLRGASGAQFHIPFFEGPSLSDLSQDLIGLDVKGEDIGPFQWPRNLRLVMGEEGRGLGDLKPTTLLKIPISAQTESLNATVASSIALYLYRQQHQLKGAPHVKPTN